MSGSSLALAGANVIMQLSQLPVGRGVIESTVESGSLYHHPFKRTRTTLGYVMISIFGDDVERAALRHEVNRQHRLVRSNEQSPITYNAFDPELQLWVAACMYRGFLDATTIFYPALSPQELDDIYRVCARFATTLQVPVSMWPADRVAFNDYWRDSLQHVHVDAATRRYLLGIASLTFLPRPLQWALGSLHRFITTGFLPEPFRRELGLTWSDVHQRRFDTFTSALATLNRLLPRVLREFPWNIALWDARRRLGHSKPFV
ncbi:MAG: oxygenase MpaB family protein [Acidimicrobiales bacterium]